MLPPPIVRSYAPSATFTPSAIDVTTLSFPMWPVQPAASSGNRHDMRMARSILVTGAAGFIGSNFVRWWLERHPDDHVVALDKLTYAGDRRNLDGLGVRLAVCDICDLDPTERFLAEENVDTVVNFAAESHNSLAVVDPGRFFRTNVLGTQALLEASRRHGVSRFHHVSTCEVYGDLPLDSGTRSPRSRPTGRGRRTTPRRRRPTTRCGRTSRRSGCP